METINFGIDLGTTNSLIAKYNAGQVEVFKNPVGFKETLPSCIAYRGDRIIVGDKAREWLLKDPLNVFSGFKRKMGTSEKFFVPTIDQFLSPIDFSSIVLRELKNFIHTGEKPASVVITIPASFDTMQSNATKKAGYDAGFQEVILLQEPIAASLAFFNREHTGNQQTNGRWLVYDLGGGTFDVALISIQENEMRVVDHKGDNFLGGVDFDHTIVVKCILPKLVATTGLTELNEELNKRNGIYEKLYFILLLKAEEAKKELSVKDQAEVEFTFTDANGKEHDVFIHVTRHELNECIKDRIADTIAMAQQVLADNNYTSADIDEIIMIGGSTYIPYVREQVELHTGIKANYSSDPTTAVAVGAAFYSGSKAKSAGPVVMPETTQPVQHNDALQTGMSMKIAYNKTTKDNEEYITGQVDKWLDGCHYRIIRNDGGYDSGMKKLSAKIGEFVSLRKNANNVFTLKVYNEKQEELTSLTQVIEITQGLFSLYGQPLPEDICIEIDDIDNNTTKCELIFERNSILPLSKTIYKEISRTIKCKSDDQIIINVLEGSHKSHPNTNQVIGVIEINGSQLSADLIKGSDVEIKIEISESRDVSVKANLMLIDYEVSEVFNPTEKYVSVTKLREEIKEIRQNIQVEINKATISEDYEKAHELQQTIEKLNDLYNRAMELSETNLSDEKYQLEEYKRKLARSYFGNENNGLLFKIKTEYYSHRDIMNYWVESYDDMPPNLKEEFEKIKQNEPNVMNSKSSFLIQNQLKTLNRLYNKMVFYSPSLLTQYYTIYANLNDDEYKDAGLAKKLVAQGDKALDRKNYEELRGVFSQLLSNTKYEISVDKIKGTGLG